MELGFLNEEFNIVKSIFFSLNSITIGKTLILIVNKSRCYALKPLIAAHPNHICYKWIEVDLLLVLAAVFVVVAAAAGVGCDALSLSFDLCHIRHLTVLSHTT